MSDFLLLLKRYLLLRTSENAVKAKFAEFPFHALGCISVDNAPVWIVSEVDGSRSYGGGT
jgi:hypothetical protein